MKKTTVALILAMGFTTACADIPTSVGFPGSVNSASPSSLQGDGIIYGLLGLAILSVLVQDSNFNF